MMNKKNTGAKKVDPIRNRTTIKRMKEYLYNQSERNCFLFCFGINSGLKISDILSLQVKDVKYASHLKIHEKTGNIRRVKMTPSLKEAIEEYTKGKDDEQYLFPSREGKKPISRVTAWNILKKAAYEVGLIESIGTATLRKTFGYHYYLETKDLAILQQIFGHSSAAVTFKFIGVNENISDQTPVDISL
jgi:integrase